MPRAYSLDLRERVLAAAREERFTHAALAVRFVVGESTMRGWLRRARETGSVAPKPHGGGTPLKVDARRAAVLATLVAEQNDRTLAELGTGYQERTGITLSLSAVWRACRRLDLRRKKRTLCPAEQTREDVVAARAARAARAAWVEARATVPAADWVFVDESGIATDLARRYGRAPGGQRAPGAVLYGRWETLTILGRLSLEGLVACMTVPGATDTPVMVAFTRTVLVPVLRPGQVVVMDNLSPHKAPRVRALIEAAGCRLLFLPPHSPDLNPIEPAWSKLKTLLRSVGARSVAALDAALTTLVDAITVEDAHGFFRHCGYAC